jgi:hypothetical protein
VENLLRLKSPSDSSEEREKNIANLHRYWQEGLLSLTFFVLFVFMWFIHTHVGVFPIGEHYHEEVARKPNFLDSHGNICAVGYISQVPNFHSPNLRKHRYLIRNTAYGGENLVNLITQHHQFSFLKDMHLPELVAWQVFFFFLFLFFC